MAGKKRSGWLKWLLIGVILASAFVLWLVAFRPRYGRRVTPDEASAAISSSA